MIEPQGTARSGLVLHGTGGTLRSTLQWRCHLTFSLPFIGIATTSLQASSRHRRVRLGACDVDVVRVSAESMSSEPECTCPGDRRGRRAPRAGDNLNLKRLGARARYRHLRVCVRTIAEIIPSQDMRSRSTY